MDSNESFKGIRDHDAHAAKEMRDALKKEMRECPKIEKVIKYTASLGYVEARCAGIIEQIEALSERVEELRRLVLGLANRVTLIEAENRTWHK